MLHRVAAFAAFPAVVACAPVSDHDARQVIDETVVASQGVGLETHLVELLVPPTGVEVAEVMNKVVERVLAEVPCSNATVVDNAYVRLDFGAGCQVGPRSLTGKVEAKYSAAASREMLIEHEWSGVSDGHVRLDGTARVAWAPTIRHVRYSGFVTGPDGKLETRGDRTYAIDREFNPRIFSVDGERSWKTELGRWAMTYVGAEIRAFEPMPQDGIVRVQTPIEEPLSMAFTRVQDGVLVRIFGGQSEHRYAVLGSGIVEEREVPEVGP